MSVYIGTLGRLVELPYVTASSITPAERYTFTETLEGRVKAQVRTVGRRVWSLSASRYLAQAQGALMSFINGEWGNGPFVWVSSDAPVTNMLTPEVARCGPQAVFSSTVSRSGPMALDDGQWSGSSLTTSDPTGTLWVGASKAPTPVIPGVPVTASAYVVGGGAKVRLHWYRADGTLLPGTATSIGSGVAGSPRRLHVTATPPVGTVSCTMSTTRAPQIARPAVTWTDTLFDWADGRGCLSAVIHGVSKDVQSAHRDPNGFRAADMSFTITEVG